MFSKCFWSIINLCMSIHVCVYIYIYQFQRKILKFVNLDINELSCYKFFLTFKTKEILNLIQLYFVFNKISDFYLCLIKSVTKLIFVHELFCLYSFLFYFFRIQSHILTAPSPISQTGFQKKKWPKNDRNWKTLF